jgi:hypothetical protein
MAICFAFNAWPLHARSRSSSNASIISEHRLSPFVGVCWFNLGNVTETRRSFARHRRRILGSVCSWCFCSVFRERNHGHHYHTSRFFCYLLPRNTILMRGGSKSKRPIRTRKRSFQCVHLARYYGNCHGQLRRQR